MGFEYSGAGRICCGAGAQFFIGKIQAGKNTRLVDACLLKLVWLGKCMFSTYYSNFNTNRRYV